MTNPIRFVRVLFPQCAVRILPANVVLKEVLVPWIRQPEITKPGDFAISALGPYLAVILAVPYFDNDEAALAEHEIAWKLWATEIYKTRRTTPPAHD